MCLRLYSKNGVWHFDYNVSLMCDCFFPGAPSSLALGSLVGYIIAFALGWGPIPMLVMSEITPVRARGAASGITVIVAWLSAFIVTKVNLHTLRSKSLFGHI